jgi:hypothetical protein
MPTTEHGITYPDPGGTTRLWEHFQAQAETTEDAITAMIGADRVATTTVLSAAAQNTEIIGNLGINPVPGLSLTFDTGGTPQTWLFVVTIALSRAGSASQVSAVTIIAMFDAAATRTYDLEPAWNTTSLHTFIEPRTITSAGTHTYAIHESSSVPAGQLWIRPTSTLNAIRIA